MLPRTLFSALAALVLITTMPVGQGCAGAAGIVRTVLDVVSWIAGKVDLVESQVQSAADRGELPPEVARRAAIVRALVERVHDGAKLTPVLIAEIERAWQDLLEVTAPFGVRAVPADGRMGAAPLGTVQVPTVDELGARLREAGR